ncbi:hypothetical protein B0T24DRAFT_380352 [Lasiosphaeria ovina]|uniref:Uncharacterized protein n=1 Tax=Lasiosphaeria ovina TaxID=92902 RepID=A0AAE0JZU2_9PEZI|nr:hypothetical protein B0T24DRAFT_380352 [Lasiosphaeria ovina]
MSQITALQTVGQNGRGVDAKLRHCYLRYLARPPKEEGHRVNLRAVTIANLFLAPPIRVSRPTERGTLRSVRTRRRRCPENVYGLVVRLWSRHQKLSSLLDRDERKWRGLGGWPKPALPLYHAALGSQKLGETFTPRIPPAPLQTRPTLPYILFGHTYVKKKECPAVFASLACLAQPRVMISRRDAWSSRCSLAKCSGRGC